MENVVVTIGHDHPSLAGHFPGNPVVPGVVILSEVMKVIRQFSQSAIELLELPSIKFVSPLHPDEPFTIQLEPYAKGERGFTCRVQTRIIAIGRVVYRDIVELKCESELAG